MIGINPEVQGATDGFIAMFDKPIGTSEITWLQLILVFVVLYIASQTLGRK